jgi:precorrin-6B methylase 2
MRKFLARILRPMATAISPNSGFSPREIYLSKSQLSGYLESKRIWDSQVHPLVNFTATSSFPAVSPISTIALESAKLFPNREKMLSDFLQDGWTVIEVGSQEGKFAEFLHGSAKLSELTVIDINVSLIQKRAKLTKLNNVRILEGDSSKILESLPKNSADLIYIDGDHSFDGVTKDIVAAIPILKENGLLVFNDYTSWSYLEHIPYGVAQAVHDLLDTGIWEVRGFAFHPWMYHDIALSRRNSK